MPTFFYARTSDKERSAARQVKRATEAGFIIDVVASDDSADGVHTALQDLPGWKRVLSKLSPGDTVLVPWLNALGRDFADAANNVRALVLRGVSVKTVFGSVVFDGAATSVVDAAVRDALLAFLGTVAEAQHEVRKDAREVGIDYAKSLGPAAMKFLGRKPAYSQEQLDTVISMLTTGAGATEIADAAGVSRQTVYRVKDDPKACQAALDVWTRKYDEI